MSIRINRVYTRVGDLGRTSLLGGEDVSKAHPRVDAYGTVDELNSILGLLRLKLNVETAEIEPLIEYLQQTLFDLGNQLAVPTGSSGRGVTTAQVTELETFCDRYGSDLPELTSFILPGGTELAALLHLARTVCRRSERVVVRLNEVEGTAETPAVDPAAIAYLNRLSDLLFILARWALRKENVEAPLWNPGRSERGL